jgi:hypothetical protein
MNQTSRGMEHLDLASDLVRLSTRTESTYQNPRKYTKLSRVSESGFSALLVWGIIAQLQRLSIGSLGYAAHEILPPPSSSNVSDTPTVPAAPVSTSRLASVELQSERVVIAVIVLPVGARSRYTRSHTDHLP